MKRRRFLNQSAALCLPLSVRAQAERSIGGELSADAVIVGGGLGGCAAALAALRHGLSVILTEETDWIGGQLTAQGVPPDEHPWIETHGAPRSYRRLREEIRAFYRRHYPLTQEAAATRFLNPGLGTVSRLCHEPRVALEVLQSWLQPYRSSGRLTVLLENEVQAAETDGDRVKSVRTRSLADGRERVLRAQFFVDATELGDLLPLTGTEFVTGAEGRDRWGELHGAEREDPMNQQAFTVCFAIEHSPGEEAVIDRPADYVFWRDFVPSLTPPWPGQLLDWTYTHPGSGQAKKLGFNPLGPEHDGVVSLWTYRRILAASQFREGTGQRDVSLVNWPQNDYFLRPLIGVSPKEKQRALREGKQLSLSWLYWLQTEAPRPDGGQGYPGLRLRPDIMGTADGLAKYPYVRESRRILAETTVLESHCGKENRAQVLGREPDAVRAQIYPDSVGVGYYPIDLHPSTGGDNYIDFGALPFQIPLGALLPRRMENLLPACKNVGTTHITNGCYRLHPVEWGMGEAVGLLLAFSLKHRLQPQAVRGDAKWLKDYQALLERDGVELAWPSED